MGEPTLPLLLSRALIRAGVWEAYGGGFVFGRLKTAQFRTAAAWNGFLGGTKLTGLAGTEGLDDRWA